MRNIVLDPSTSPPTHGSGATLGMTYWKVPRASQTPISLTIDSKEIMENKLSVCILEGYENSEEVKDLIEYCRSVNIPLNFGTQKSPPNNIGGDFTVLHDLIIIIGVLLFENIFSDIYEKIKNKIYNIYKIFKKDEINKAKVLNLVLAQDGKVMMFVFDFSLSLEDFHIRFGLVKDNYKKYFKENEKHFVSGRPLIFLWKNNSWSLRIEEI